MPSRSPEHRSLAAAIGGHTRAARYDGREVTAKARNAFTKTKRTIQRTLVLIGRMVRGFGTRRRSYE